MEYSEYLNNRKPIQELGCNLLLERKHACLYFKPGKGKTYPCIDAVLAVQEAKNRPIAVLVLSTASSIKNMWLPEIDTQHIMPADTIYLSFSTAIGDKYWSQLLGVRWDVMVVDECHKVKSHNSQISKLVYRLSQQIEYVFGLTGTPRGNSDTDIYCQFHNMCISKWGDVPWSHFVNDICITQDKYVRGMKFAEVVGIKPEYKAGWQRNIAMYSLTADYDEDDNMPALNTEVIVLNYVPSKQYKDLESNIIDMPEYEYRKTLTKMTAVAKAQQAANGFLYLTDDTGESKRTCVFEHNHKLDWLHDHVVVGDVIVYLFQADEELISKELDNMGLSHTGVVSEYKAGKADILLLQCSMCDSYNLQQAHRLIFYTMNYSYILYDQMIHRLWRMEQTEDIQIIILLNDCLTEKHVWQVVSQKKSLSDLFFGLREAING